MSRKKSNNILISSILFAFICIFLCVGKVSADTYGDWEYNLSDAGITITAYNGSDKNVVIPTSINGYTVIKIADYVFCDNQMTEVTIPEGITSIGNGAFKNCEYLSKINFNARSCADMSSNSTGTAYYYNSANFSAFYNAGTKSNGISVIFGAQVKRIPSYLFATNVSENSKIYANVTSVVIPSSVTYIGYYSFYCCYQLSDVTWGNSVQIIGERAFADCWALKNVVIPETVTGIGNAAFKNCQSLTSIIFNARNCADMDSSSVGTAYYYNSANFSVFYNAGVNSEKLNVVFGSTVKEIPAYLFGTSEGYNYGDGAYAHITSVIISSNVTRIGASAFDNCFDLVDVTWGGEIQTIENYAFASCCSLKNIVIPATTTSIGEGAFQYCTDLTSITFNARNCADMNQDTFYSAGSDSDSLSVTFGSTVKEIPAYLFATFTDYNYGDGDYVHITSVRLSSSITRIGEYAFTNCFELSDVTWGAGIQTIENDAFAACWALKTVVIPESTTFIGNKAFWECTRLNSITFNARNCEDMDSDSATSYYDDYSVFKNAGANSSSLSVTFGPTVKEIPAYLFATDADYNYGDGGYAHITSVDIASSVTYIGEYAFANCYDLKTVTFKKGYVSRGKNAFLNLPSSTKIVYSNSVSVQKTIITKIQNTASGIKLNWKKVSGVQYNIYRKVGSGAWKKLATVSGSTYTDKTASNGIKYSYKISCYKSGKESCYSGSRTISRLTRPTITTLKNVSTKKITVKWKKNSKATGYQIQYATSSSFKGAKSTTISKAKTISKTISGLSKGKYYYVRMRAYKKSGKTRYYSAWSKTKKVYIKR